MTKSNNKWVPEVGQECERLLSIGSFTVNDPPLFASGYYHGQTMFGGHIWENKNGSVQVLPSDTSFRAIKTEAEKRLDELTGMLWNDLDKFYEGTDCTTSYDTARYLISVGWMKSQPLTDDVIDSVMKHAKFSLTTYRDFAKAIEAYIRGEG